MDEYEPESSKNDSSSTYVPSGVEVTLVQNDEYEPEVDEPSSNYTPAVDHVAKSYVNIYQKEAVKGEEAPDESSSDDEFEFKPIAETIKANNSLTEEEKQNFTFAFAKHDLNPEDLPTVPDVSGIIVPPQQKMLELGVVEKIMSQPMALVVVQSKSGN